jgi:hypothetical protein
MEQLVLFGCKGCHAHATAPCCDDYLRQILRDSRTGDAEHWTALDEYPLKQHGGVAVSDPGCLGYPVPTGEHRSLEETRNVRKSLGRRGGDRCRRRPISTDVRGRPCQRRPVGSAPAMPNLSPG